MEDRATPSLSEVARTIYWEPGLDIDEATLNDGLRAAMVDPSDERERQRLRNLIIDHNRLRREDEVAEFLADAQDHAGDDADIEEVIELAWELKAESEDSG